MKRAVLVAGVVAVLVAGVAVESVRAQARTTSGSGFGSSGTSTVSSSGLGASSFGSSSGLGATSGTGGATTFGQSILGLSAGSSILGTGTGGFGASSGGLGGGSAFGASGGATGASSNVGYGAMAGTLGGYNALGGQTGGTTGQFGGGQTLGGGLGLTGTTGRGGQATRGGQGQFGGQLSGQSQNVQPQVPVRLQLGFTPPRTAPNVVATNLQTNLQKIVSDRRLGSAQIAMDGDVTVISGRTASESQRRLIQTIVSMQPGVATIRNEIVVAPEDENSGN